MAMGNDRRSAIAALIRLCRTAAFVHEVLDFQATERDADAPGKNVVHGLRRLAAVETNGAGNQPGNGLAAPSNDDLLSLLDPVEQGAEPVLGLESPAFAHDRPLTS